MSYRVYYMNALEGEHTDIANKNNFKKPAKGQHVAGLKFSLMIIK